MTEVTTGTADTPIAWLTSEAGVDPRHFGWKAVKYTLSGDAKPPIFALMGYSPSAKLAGT
jgi:hypothetical protein